MAVLSSELRKALDNACVEGRRTAEEGCRAELDRLGVVEAKAPTHLQDDERELRRGLRAKRRQLGDEEMSVELLLAECAYEQWHRLLFACFLAENKLLIHPEYRAPVSLAECAELASELGESDAWGVAARFAAEILPGIFRLDDPCVRLRLAPESRLALEAIVEALPREVFTSDDGLGWVYQYWQREKKDEVNASERKIGDANLGPVTQLFTESYMVRFLLENSLGAWWVSRHPESLLQTEWAYLRSEEAGRPVSQSFDGWPGHASEVTVVDPCCGSGHFLVEAFEMLWRMRAEEEGLAPLVAQDAVLADNLFGLELDPRCVEIAIFAVALAAWKAGGGWRELPVPNIATSGIPVKTPAGEWSALAQGDLRLEQALETLHVLFRDAGTLGSLIDPRRAVEASTDEQYSLEGVEWGDISALLDKALAREVGDPAIAVLGANASATARAADLLTRKYTLVVTNVPFLARGRQSATLAAYLDHHFPNGRADLATAMLERLWRLTAVNGCLAAVSPIQWLFLASYRDFRKALLTSRSLALLFRLGSGAFRGISGEVSSVSLLVASNTPPPGESSFLHADLTGEPGLEKKAFQLRSKPLETLHQEKQLVNPNSIISPAYERGAPLLSEFADGYAGIQTGDLPRFVRFFWELPTVDGKIWAYYQGTVDKTSDWGGLEKILFWEEGHGAFHQFVSERLAGNVGAWIRGVHCRGKAGVSVSQMGQLPVAMYSGELFDPSNAVILPKRTEDLPAIWHYCRSSEFATNVRAIDQSLKVTNQTLVKAPFDIDRWRRIAQEAGPLPEPSSDDPTQWLFEGRPEVSSDPLQVAVGRLLGFRWPKQTEHDELTQLADSDGIVCLASVLGERPAAERLQELLARAYGATWSPTRTRELLAASGSKKTDLDLWLRDEFFKAHCRVFQNRPFAWHIWDGLKDGFSALVNYHRLDGRTLRRLAYTYLGDWIERQEAADRESVAGAETRLLRARDLQQRLALILEGEPPHDIFVRWKSLAEQPVGWDPDVNDGVRINIRPFVEAGVLRAQLNVKWNKDRGKNPDDSERLNNLHFTVAQKRAARDGASA